MIPPCPDQFWSDVARMVADKIMIREASMAGIKLDKPGVVQPLKTEPPEGPRAA